MLNLQLQTQLLSLWKAVENLDDSHAAGMVHPLPVDNGQKLFAYTVTDAVKYSSYVPLKSVIL